MSAENSPLQVVEAYWQRKKPDSPIYSFLLGDISLNEATSGSIVAYLEIGAVHVNSRGGLHGAVSATLIDWAGGMAIASTGAEKVGVSTDIHASYVNSAKVGDTLKIEAKVSKLGRNLAYTSIDIRRLSDDVVVCSGLHTKYVG